MLVLVGCIPRFPVPVLQPFPLTVSHPCGLLEQGDTLLLLLSDLDTVVDVCAGTAYMKPLFLSLSFFAVQK